MFWSPLVVMVMFIWWYKQLLFMAFTIAAVLCLSVIADCFVIYMWMIILKKKNRFIFLVWSNSCNFFPKILFSFQTKIKLFTWLYQNTSNGLFMLGFSKIRLQNLALLEICLVGFVFIHLVPSKGIGGFNPKL